MKKGIFALSKTAELILILLGLIVFMLFIYFLRDKIMEFVKVITDFLG
tara:strand:- start:533 stop:676 length:144 start_codon:yes stop_codon:yes gene_type:complete